VIILKKRAQAAMEFLMTYGWAILVVLIAISALAYFGVLNPSRFLPESCTLVPGMSCVDFKVDESNITLVIQNGMGQDLENFAVTIASDTNCSFAANWTCDGTQCGPSASNFTLTDSEDVKLICTSSNHGLSSGARYKKDISISYKKGMDGLTHTDLGQLITKIE